MTARVPPLIPTLGMDACKDSGVIGYPSYATAGKGKAVLASLTKAFAEHLASLGGAS